MCGLACEIRKENIRPEVTRRSGLHGSGDRIGRCILSPQPFFPVIYRDELNQCFYALSLPARDTTKDVVPDSDRVEWRQRKCINRRTVHCARNNVAGRLDTIASHRTTEMQPSRRVRGVRFCPVWELVCRGRLLPCFRRGHGTGVSEHRSV